MVYMGSVTNDNLWGVGGEVAGVWRSGRSCRILLGWYLANYGSFDGAWRGLRRLFMIPSCTRTLWVAQAGGGIARSCSLRKPFKSILLFTNSRTKRAYTVDDGRCGILVQYRRSQSRLAPRTETAPQSTTYSKHHFWLLSHRIEYPVEDPGVMVLG